MAILVLTGCNVAFGLDTTVLIDAADEVDATPPPPDRDRDGIPDPDDECIAGIADRMSDWDGDGANNSDDPCPFDYESFDSDADNIYDDCDAFPSLGGDRRLCVMTFQNPTINRELWTPRAGDDAAWNLYAFTGIVGGPRGTLLAGEGFERPAVTSYDVPVYVTGPIAPATEGAIALWLRTGNVAAPSDLGCEVRGSATVRLSLLGPVSMTSAPIAHSLATTTRLQATISPGTTAGRANVRCVVRFASMPTTVTVSAEVAVPDGHVGFAVEGTTTTFQGIMTSTRPDLPML